MVGFFACQDFVYDSAPHRSLAQLKKKMLRACMFPKGWGVFQGIYLFARDSGRRDFFFIPNLIHISDIKAIN